MGDPMHFDARAAAYERARPPYPEQLWQRLAGLGLLSRGARVLELGAGTGQATERLVAAGAEVTAVEPGPALAERLRSRFPDVVVQGVRAEDAVLSTASFDLAVAATAVHWLDIDVVLPMLHDALVPGGTFAVWRNVFGDPDAAMTPFRERVEDIVARRPPSPPRLPGEMEAERWGARLAGRGLFAVESIDRWRWSIELDADRVRDLFSTFSDWSQAEADEAGAAVLRLGGRVTEHYGTWLVVLRRVSPS